MSTGVTETHTRVFDRGVEIRLHPRYAVAMKWGEYVKQQREAREWSMRELARRSELAVGVISNIESGETIGHADSVSRIQRALGLDPTIVNRLVRGESVDAPEIVEPSAIDLARSLTTRLERELRDARAAYDVGDLRLQVQTSRASAGPGSAALDEITYHPDPSYRDHSHRAIEVSGDCMEPEIQTGDLVIVDTELPPEIGDIVVAVHDGEYNVKMLERDDDGWLLVAHDDRPSLRPNGETEMVGVVVSVQRRVQRGRRARRT